MYYLTPEFVYNTRGTDVTDSVNRSEAINVKDLRPDVEAKVLIKLTQKVGETCVDDGGGNEGAIGLEGAEDRPEQVEQPVVGDSKGSEVQDSQVNLQD